MGLGLDMVEVGALEGGLRRQGGAFLRRVFSPGELEELGLGELGLEGLSPGGTEAGPPGPRQVEALAARFAAKEAAFKALGTGWAQGVGWHDVQVRRQASGQPQLVLSGRAEERARELGAERWLVSLTHAGGWAAAVVVLEGRGPGG